MIDREKIMATAQKLIEKGRLDDAIEEYAKLAHDDAADARTRLKIGDLHVKAGRIPAAIASYTEVADLYAAQGFALKAVAVLKQVLALDPNLVEPQQRLAELQRRLGVGP